MTREWKSNRLMQSGVVGQPLMGIPSSADSDRRRLNVSLTIWRRRRTSLFAVITRWTAPVGYRRRKNRKDEVRRYVALKGTRCGKRTSKRDGSKVGIFRSIATRPVSAEGARTSGEAPDWSESRLAEAAGKTSIGPAMPGLARRGAVDTALALVCNAKRVNASAAGNSKSGDSKPMRIAGFLSGDFGRSMKRWTWV